MSSEDLQDLILRGKQGEVEAFNQLVQVYQTQVYNLALRMLSDASAAEDIAQEAFLSAFHHLHSFHGGNFRAWLLRIAANACRDYLRSARVRRSVSLEAMMENPGFAPQAAIESPEDYTLRQEVAEVLQTGLGTLPLDQRLALVLVDVQGLRYEEAAEAMKVPVGTVKSRLSRGRAAMRQFLLKRPELLPRAFRLE